VPSLAVSSRPHPALAVRPRSLGGAAPCGVQRLRRRPQGQRGLATSCEPSRTECDGALCRCGRQDGRKTQAVLGDAVVERISTGCRDGRHDASVVPPRHSYSLRRCVRRRAAGEPGECRRKAHYGRWGGASVVGRASIHPSVSAEALGLGVSQLGATHSGAPPSPRGSDAPSAWPGPIAKS
jgi:hypothetical protein